MFDTKKLALFLGGVVFGSAGFKVLSSKDAKKIYTQTTAAPFWLPPHLDR